MTETTKRPMTAADIFNAVVQRIKDKGAYPEKLDYALAENPDYAVPVPTDEYGVLEELDWGGSEGIYLDIKLEFEDESGRRHIASAGTFKTLESDDNAMYYMAKLLADYLIEDSAFRRENYKDLRIEGYLVETFGKEGRRLQPTIWYKTKADAREEAERQLKKHPKVMITELSTGLAETFAQDGYGFLADADGNIATF